ncbi:VOC family protein [Euzebya tangerina]|uniref:VOC family protein n=1 Tax=Euzebya tangerina TaxID=591198 RepID=UPI0013C37488|nr:VOC family protein [Euzebya tangerina]
MTFVEASHVGFVVADLDRSADELATLLGVRWASVLTRDLPVRTPRSTVQANIRVTYSLPTSGPTLIELIEGQAGTPWWPGDDQPWAFHHIGFWADRLSQESVRLTEAGKPLAGTVDRPEEAGAAHGFAYHDLDHGPRVELVDAARRMSFQSWLAGGHFPLN